MLTCNGLNFDATSPSRSLCVRNQSARSRQVSFTRRPCLTELQHRRAASCADRYPRNVVMSRVSRQVTPAWCLMLLGVIRQTVRPSSTGYHSPRAMESIRAVRYVQRRPFRDHRTRATVRECRLMSCFNAVTAECAASCRKPASRTQFAPRLRDRRLVVLLDSRARAPKVIRCHGELSCSVAFDLQTEHGL